MAWVNVSLIALAGLCLAPVAIFCAECLLALLPRRRSPAPSSVGPRPCVAVVIPAHNEATVLESTIRSIRPQLVPGDRILVVADNCTDRTAAVARRLEVEVVERFDAHHRGKGYALDCGVSHLDREGNPPGLVILVDADCTVQPGAIETLARQVITTGRPAQADYLLERPPASGPRDQVSALAFLVKNRVRPTGLRRAGLPCLFTGTGMAFPWHAIVNAPLASADIVEDMKLSLDLSLRGLSALYCADARVTGRLPVGMKVAYVQRTRWEHGHLQTVLTQVPQLFKAALRHRAPQALALAFEMSVPPLALLAMLLCVALAGTTAAAVLGASWLAAKLVAGGIVAMGLCLFGAWAKYGRQSLPIASLLAAPLYMAWKVPMYVAFLFHRQTEWLRTAREEAPPEFELPPAGAVTDGFDRDYNRDVLPSTETQEYASRAGQLQLGDVVRPTRTVAGCVDHVVESMKLGRGGFVVLPTVEHLQWCALDRDFARIMTAVELVADDEALASTPATQTAFVAAIARAAAGNNRSIFLLGDDAEITAEAAAALTLGEPTLRLAGIYSAPDGFDSEHEAFRHVTRAVTRAKPDLVLVALGTPKQERLIDKLQRHLPAAWWLAVGSSFKFVCRETRRSRARHGLHHKPPAPPLDELGQLLARGVDHITVTDRAPRAETPPPPSTVVYQSFLHGIQSGLREDDAPPLNLGGPLAKLKGLVLLGGSLRPSPLSIATGRSLLDLPLEDGRSILWHWRDHAVELRQRLGISVLPVQVLIDPSAPALTAPQRGNHVPVTVRRDASAYRGTAGVLRDLCDEATFAADDYLLVATAAQVLPAPLWQAAGLLSDLDADAAVVAHEDGTPSGLMLIRCGALEAIPRVGYVDLKEQALPLMAKSLNVRHLPRPTPTGLPVRSAAEYIAAVQHRHRQQLGRSVPADPFAEDCRPSFAVVEERASIHPTAQVHDSVILQGAQIGEGATVVRSVVCPGARLPRNHSAIDAVIPCEVSPSLLA